MRKEIEKNKELERVKDRLALLYCQWEQSKWGSERWAHLSKEIATIEEEWDL